MPWMDESWRGGTWIAELVDKNAIIDHYLTKILFSKRGTFCLRRHRHLDNPQTIKKMSNWPPKGESKVRKMP